MGIKNKTLRWILPSCLKSTITQKMDSRIHVAIHSSNSRISLSDISDPGSPLCLSDLSSSKFASNLHIFTFSELRLMTGDFSSVNFLGEGGFGPVHKGFVDDKCRPGLSPQAVAVKVLDPDGDQGFREWLTEVVLLGQLKHPHLVKLIGYCCEDDHRLLVYEYMARGNLENHLFRRYASLAWETRIKIALGAAKGLAFLHGEEKPVIYRDFKTSNILLDSDYNARLSDFGLAKDGPEGDETHVSTTRIMGTHGYAAPEYIMTGHLTTKSDVYSFGVVLLELLTGRRAMDKKRPPREQNLVDWAKPYLKDHHKLDSIIDPRLEGQYSSEGARRVAALAHQCLNHSPKYRPTMSQLVKILELIGQLRDMPFVYIAPAEGKADAKIKEHKEDGDEDDKKVEKETGRKSRRKGYRHKHPMRARGVYTDTHLYRAYKNEMISVGIEGR